MGLRSKLPGAGWPRKMRIRARPEPAAIKQVSWVLAAFATRIAPWWCWPPVATRFATCHEVGACEVSSFRVQSTTSNTVKLLMADLLFMFFCVFEITSQLSRRIACQGSPILTSPLDKQSAKPVIVGQSCQRQLGARPCPFCRERVQAASRGLFLD